MMEGMQKVAALLQKAITLHKGHMNGSVPTSEKSQRELMDLIEDAYEALPGGKMMMPKERNAMMRADFDSRMDAEKQRRKA